MGGFVRRRMDAIFSEACPRRVSRASFAMWRPFSSSCICDSKRLKLLKLPRETCVISSGGTCAKPMSILRSRFRDERGFNLIELMIVIAIIGLLIGVGSYAWQSMMKSGNETAAAQTMDKIRVYENQYAAKNRGKF